MKFEYIITQVDNNRVIHEMSFKKLCKRLKTENPNELVGVSYINKKGNKIYKDVFNGKVVKWLLMIWILLESKTQAQAV